ncbi:alpha-hydroxy acid oxidase [Marinobacter similis]|uniref:2-hydroxy-acid oxidase n=1 Tax=Marinobacter similis TaxID=1420916 RepID=W5YGG5_9GAMM|nr:alpha-hydroxy acid oxidase [Marinobacter similis]AHI28292.1 2-hydroxy-acid oxidase [Marinobacter similis]
MATIREPLERIPASLVSVSDYERLASEFLEPATLAYIAGGSGNEQSLRANIEDIARLSIRNRLLVDCAQGHTRVSLMGQGIAHPVLLAPVGHQGLVHRDGEVAVAQGAAATDTALIASTQATRRLEDIAAATDSPKWFQLYFQPRKENTLALVQRAEAAGYTALVVTLDTPVQSLSRRAQRAGFRLPAHCQPANLADFSVQDQPTTGAAGVFQGLMATAPGWQDLTWLLGQTRLPVIVKGVLDTDDAEQCQRMGIAGLILSNHGGRALDGVPSALSVLPAVRARLGAAYPLLIDGGIRSGYDVFKALACGANAVLVGRPQVYALAVAGALGVAHMLKLFRDELELCMALAGTPTVADISARCLAQDVHFTNPGYG